MIRTLLTILAVLSLAASASLAQDEVGFYFDAEGTATAATTSVPGEWVQGWLILRDATHMDGIGSWRSNLVIEHADGTPAATQWQYAGGAQNFDVPPRFDVATFAPLPWSSTLVLGTVLITVPDPADEIEIYLGGHRFPEMFEPADYPVYQPEYGHGVEYEPAAMRRSSGHSHIPIATINGDGLTDDMPGVGINYQMPDLAAVGYPIAGIIRYTVSGVVRPLEGVVEPISPGLEFRRTYDSNSGTFGDPLAWTASPVWTRFPLPIHGLSNSSDWYEVRFTPQQVGYSFNLGYRLSFGDEVFESFQQVQAIAEPCEIDGEAGFPAADDIEDGILTWGAYAGQSNVGRIWVHNITRSDGIPITVTLSGSPTFSSPDLGYVTLGPNDYHFIDITFEATTTGWHDGLLTVEGAGDFEVELRGWGIRDRLVLDAEAPGVATRLLPAHPNPFNPATTVSFELAQAGRARLSVYGLDGRLVKVLADEEFGAGPAQRTWSGRDSAGRTVASGVYVVRLEAGDVRESRRITLLK